MGLLVFDWGGTSVKGGVFQKNEMIEPFSFPTPKTWEEMMQQLKEKQEELAKTYSFKGVAISAPGVVDDLAGVINGISAIPYIHHFEIKAALQELFGLPVHMINDANAAGMAEAVLGAAKGKENVLFLILGTGVGGVFVQNGQIYTGHHGYAGEYGMMFIDGAQTFSEVGTVVRLVERYEQRTGETGLNGEEIFRRADQGEAAAKEEVAQFYRYLATGIFNLQVAFDPDCIVLGGGISGRPAFMEEIKQAVEQFVAEKEWQYFMPVVMPCTYRNSANLIGAAVHFESQQS
ncbi:ROK family protein [Listeria costaricensis]|uniref:ROK family protein n=1 Tax=Listeria costaricensis TaxID=2026604 RepID=UPI000C073C9B|nr:ROK family protein [Listeria costaricensis]